MSARHVTLLAALSAIWGGSYLLIKYALEGFSAAMIVSARCLLASVVLYVVLRTAGWRRRRWADLRERPRWALILGVTAVAVPFLLITFGEHVVPSGLTAVLISPASLFIALLAPFLLPSESIDRRQGAGMLLGLAGVVLVVGVESVHSLKEFLGAMAMIGAAFFYGLSSFVVKGRYGTLAAVQTSWIWVTVAGLLTLPVGIATTPGHTPGLGAIAALVALGVVGTALAFVIYYELIAGDRGGARRARLLPRPGRRAVLRRDLPRRGDHGRRDRRAGADPRRRGDRLAAQARRRAGACARAGTRLTAWPPRGPDALAGRRGIPRHAARLDRRQPPGPGAGGRRGVVRVPPRLAAQAQRARLGRPDLADRVRRRRRDADRAGDPVRGVRALAGAADGQRARADDGRPDGHRARHRRSEGALPLADPVRRRDVVPGLLRARVGLRPRVAEDARGAQGRRVRRHRPEGVDDVRAPLQVVHAARAHEPGRAQAPRAHLLPDGHGAGRRRHPAAGPDHRRGRVQRALHRRGADPGRERRRRRRQRLARGDHDADARARRARLRAAGAGPGGAGRAGRRAQGRPRTRSSASASRRSRSRRRCCGCSPSAA